MQKKIKIAFFVYPSAFQNIGGGEILLIKTKEYLKKLGMDAEFFDIWNDKLEDFDLLHVVGSVRHCLGLMQTAKNKGLKVVLTPVFFSTLQRAMHEHVSIKRKLATSIRHLVKIIFPYFPSDRRKMMLVADAVIPNSIAEKRQLARLFKIDVKKMHIIPNGVDSSFENGDSHHFILKYKIENFILSVGRIEPRKNQLNLIKAMKGFSKPLVFIGDPVSDYMDYYNECKRIAGDNVYFFGRLEHDSALLKSAYAACSCFVLQAWLETPGLAALEAALAGANIAVTSRGCTKEYFKGYAEYFNPSNLKSIRGAVERTSCKNKSGVLKEYIKKNFLWDTIASKNLVVYSSILNNQ